MAGLGITAMALRKSTRRLSSLPLARKVTRPASDRSRSNQGREGAAIDFDAELEEAVASDLRVRLDPQAGAVGVRATRRKPLSRGERRPRRMAISDESLRVT